ncbi:hypothetical protein [Nonomuraea aurantiaca]|uniref:hypothetical protein n=1 Tax=Nonomuraea aurantiaca TaxID=2878562 RepID=UPI001CDA02CB|nr:hypothetical protein [Nonomuraea aurantiaca]MCA2221409.1 hypothetical protein [Nonomuraea aurantiaca]
MHDIVAHPLPRTRARPAGAACCTAGPGLLVVAIVAIRGLLVVAIVASVVLGSPSAALLAVYAVIGTIWVAAGIRRLFPAPERQSASETFKHSAWSQP